MQVFFGDRTSFLCNVNRCTAESDAMAKICQLIDVCIQCCYSAANLIWTSLLLVVQTMNFTRI